ncbi:hypothetical protein CC78DRAFT_534204 [Lojkania enalia]|uniref:Bromo domain-containing protein n=1 Tax=Lojkania enalia TaxID=147567 RepID=A0A9P4N7X6_9PLEO|nr:hypothetical protein CC78DRAFT_534204 [Didymosphaeria enalia]
MNTSLTAYTHLESLLLFQSLVVHGIEPPAFSRISELLKNNPQIRGHSRFESGRLSPDALRNLYLHLLKEEIKSERQDDASDVDGQSGERRNMRKRKAPSPSPPTAQEASRRRDLIPKLVNRLYARYRTAITNQIREDEQKYERLQRELQEIECGEWDSHLRERVKGKSPKPSSPGLARRSPPLPQKQLTPGPGTQLAVQDGLPPGSPSDNIQIPDGPQLTGMGNQKSAPQNGQILADRNTKIPTVSPRNEPTQTQTPSTPQPILGPAPTPQQSRGPQVVIPPPRFSSSQLTVAGPNGAPSHTHRSPYPPPTSQGQGQIPQEVPPSATPHAPGQLSQPHTQTPVPIAPPPAAPAHSQTIQPLGGNGVPQYGPMSGPSPQFSPTQQRYPGPHPNLTDPQSPGVQTPQQQRALFPAPSQPAYPPPQQPQAGQLPPGGVMLPPFQVSLQDPSRAQHQPDPLHHAQVATPMNNRQLSAKTASPAGSFGAGVAPFYPPTSQGRSSLSTPLSVHTPLSVPVTPRSAKTLWKPSAKNLATPLVPRPEVNPIDDLPSLQQPKQSQQKVKATKKPRSKAKLKDKVEAESAAEPVAEPETTEGHTPGAGNLQSRTRRKAPARRTRLGSITSSQAGGSNRDRSRSQSIVSHTETVAADNESQAGYHVKTEPGTSVDVIEEESVGTLSQHSTSRGRGRMMKSFHSSKRKRDAREPSVADSEDQPSTPGLPRTIIAPRHFSRMCNPIMNDITSHKHASIFTTAVRAKDAEGYYDIIKRPTDLRSIQKAINAGTKLVTTAANDTPTGSPGGSGGIIELPMTTDVIPPKAIVNSAQLERELMRMFVNAVMFNAGEEGVVEDTREMFENVQHSVSNWRSIEPTSGRLEVEETPPVAAPEEEAPAAAKRRKV